MTKKGPSIRSIAGAVLAWVRGERRHDGSELSRSAFPTTGMGVFGEDDPAASFTALQWHASYESGHPVIDEQHRALFEIGNELIQAAQRRKPKGEVELLLYEFVEHITEHFDTEEQVLARTRFPLSEQHMEIHRQLLERARELRDWYRKGQLAVSELVSFIAYDVISDHILKEDRKFALRDR